MAAVAGAVADEMLAALTAGRSLETAYVNNGGDIAVHLAPGAALDLGVRRAARQPRHRCDGEADPRHAGARNRDQRLARSQPVVRHRGFGDRPGARRGGRRCRGDPDRKRGHGRGSRDRAAPRLRARRRQRPGRPSGHRRRGAVVEGGGGGSAGPGRPRGAVDARCWTHRGGNGSYCADSTASSAMPARSPGPNPEERQMDDARTVIETTAEGDFGSLVKVRSSSFTSRRCCTNSARRGDAATQGLYRRRHR